MIKTTFPGSDMKFKVTTTQPDFQLTDDDFTIIIKDQYGRIWRTIKKEDCFQDSVGQWYFNVENIHKGVFYAYFKGSYEDDDYVKQQRAFTDCQLLYEVPVPTDCCKIAKFAVAQKRQCEHSVHYEEVYTVSIGGAEYLADVNGEYILTSDGKRIQFNANDNDNGNRNMSKVKLNMTGEQFKQLIEGNNPNGVIDTLPEMLDAARGISDTTTIKEDVEDQMGDNQADSGDIDEIFGGGTSSE